MKQLIPALAFFALAIICAAGAIYSALAKGVEVANGATLGTMVFAAVAMILWDKGVRANAAEKSRENTEEAEVASWR